MAKKSEPKADAPSVAQDAVSAKAESKTVAKTASKSEKTSGKKVAGSPAVADDDVKAKKAEIARKMLEARRATQAKQNAARHHVDIHNRGVGSSGKPTSGHSPANVKNAVPQKRGGS